MINDKLLCKAESVKDFIDDNTRIMSQCEQALDDINKDGIRSIYIVSKQKRDEVATCLNQCRFDPELNDIIVNLVAKAVGNRLLQAEYDLKSVIDNINLPGF
ncbi:hypothetical protein [Robinsoniella peoriensis]|uniref:hypothetical protein n=1 Tax=Robinsoniella peoriensis TaxID=180332 RepID=UPI003641F5CD